MQYLFKTNFLIEKEDPAKNKTYNEIKSINVVSEDKYGSNIIDAIKGSIQNNETFIELMTIEYQGELVFNGVPS